MHCNSHFISVWLSKLDALIQTKHMLSTPFYEAWTQGKLSKDTLRKYAKQYYYHVKAFPTYLSALHSRSNDMQVRRCILDNLIDEEAGNPNHPQLWRSFALVLGVTEKEIDSDEAAPETQELINCFQHYCRNGSLAEGLVTLYCYESQIPRICTSKIEGLKQWYGMHDPDHYRYFSVHEEADVEHARMERELLEKLVEPKAEKAVLEAAQNTLEALWSFLGSFENHAMVC